MLSFGVGAHLRRPFQPVRPVTGTIQEADPSMAKRQRGSTRPGQRAPSKSTPGRPAAAPSPTQQPARALGTLTDDDLARAAEIEARIVEEERLAGASLARSRDRRRGAEVDAPVRGRRAVSTLAIAAADEYTYVQRDLRRIAIVFIGIFAILFAAFIVVSVTGIARSV